MHACMHIKLSLWCLEIRIDICHPFFLKDSQHQIVVIWCWFQMFALCSTWCFDKCIWGFPRWITGEFPGWCHGDSPMEVMSLMSSPKAGVMSQVVWGVAAVFRPWLQPNTDLTWAKSNYKSTLIKQHPPLSFFIVSLFRLQFWDIIISLFPLDSSLTYRQRQTLESIISTVQALSKFSNFPFRIIWLFPWFLRSLPFRRLLQLTENPNYTKGWGR